MSAATTREQVPPFLREIFDRSLPDLRNRLATLEELLNQFFNGREELLSDCVKAAHDLTGSLGVFGLAAPSESAAFIETTLRHTSSSCDIDQQIIHLKINDLRDAVHV